MTAPGWLVDQHQAAAVDLAAQVGAQPVTVVPGPAAGWPEWLREAIAHHDQAAAVEPNRCPHLGTSRGPRPVGTSPLTPGLVWCAACTEIMLAVLTHEFIHCDGCGVDAVARYRLVALAGPVAHWLLVCLECRAELVGPC